MTEPIIVVGAGPAGLTVGYFLQKVGLAFRILERGEIGQTWRQQYDDLHLHTLKGVSALPGLPMPDHFPSFPSAEHLVEYLEQYATHFALPITTRLSVERASYTDDEWRLETSDGTLRTPLLVLTTGIWSRPHSPRLAGQEAFGGQIIHSACYQNPHPFLGQRVLVVGLGNSGSEIAVQLAEAGVEVGVVEQRGVNFVRYPRSALAMHLVAWAARTLPRRLMEPLIEWGRPDFDHLGLVKQPGSVLDAYPVVGLELPEMVAAGRVQVYPVIERLTGEGVRFADGSERPIDQIILATGFRPALEFLKGEVAWDARGWPLRDRYRSTVNSALYLVGYRYPPTEGWLQSIGRRAEAAVEQIVRHTQQSGAS